MQLTPETHPYLEEAKQQDLFECLEDQQPQADLLSHFVPGSNWAVWIGWSSQLTFYNLSHTILDDFITIF